MIGLSLYGPKSMVHSFYEKLKKMSENNMPMSLIEQSIFNKLQKKYGSNDIVTTVSNDGYMNDITLMESIFIHEERFNASFEKLKKMQGHTPYENCLNSKATIDDLQEIFQHYDKGVQNS